MMMLDSTLLDKTIPLGEFLDEQLARAKDIENAKTDEIIETEHSQTPDRPSSHRYELPKIPEGHVMNQETTRDILACRDRDDLEKLLCKYNEKSLNAK